MTEKINTLAKISRLPQILDAASFLFNLGLIGDRPEIIVKQYVEDNPDINEYMGLNDADKPL